MWDEAAVPRATVLGKSCAPPATLVSVLNRHPESRAAAAGRSEAKRRYRLEGRIRLFPLFGFGKILQAQLHQAGGLGRVLGHDVQDFAAEAFDLVAQPLAGFIAYGEQQGGDMPIFRAVPEQGLGG